MYQSNRTYRDAVRVFLPDPFGFCFPLLKRVLVLELGLHSNESAWPIIAFKENERRNTYLYDAYTNPTFL